MAAWAWAGGPERTLQTAGAGELLLVLFVPDQATAGFVRDLGPRVSRRLAALRQTVCAAAAGAAPDADLLCELRAVRRADASKQLHGMTSGPNSPPSPPPSLPLVPL